jgi:radical SAM protein with 4Fe4S-binding SPASM domain
MKDRTISQTINARASKKNIPLSVLLELTWRCSQRCYFCYQKHHSKKASGELTAQEWCRVLDQLSRAGTLYLTVSGGEPFMRRDIFGILEHARRLGFAVSIITCGSHLDPAAARRLARLGIMDAGVSFHAGSAPLHDRLAGTKGSFRRALNAVRLLRRAGIKVIVKHTVSSANFGEYEKLEKLAEREKSLFECDAFVLPQQTGTQSPFALSAGQFRSFIRDMNAVTVFKQYDAALHCDAGRSVAGISPYGMVVPCIQLPIPFGSLQKCSFSAVWNGSAAARFRKQEQRLLAECEKCADRTFCSRCHGLAFFEAGEFRGKSASLCSRAAAMRQEYHKTVDKPQV